MIDIYSYDMVPLSDFLAEYKELNTNNRFRPVAVGRYGIRTRESIYSKELAQDYSKNKLIYKDTLTVGMGSVQMDIGILTDDITYSISPAYHTYRINGINCDYLRFCLQARNADMFERYKKRGSRQGKSIDLKAWLHYLIPVYEIDGQWDIALRFPLMEVIAALISLRIRMSFRQESLFKSKVRTEISKKQQFNHLKVQCVKVITVCLLRFPTILKTQKNIWKVHRLFVESTVQN